MGESCYRSFVMTARDTSSPTNPSKSTRCSILASALVLGGCSATVYAPASELTRLQPTVLRESSDWPVVQTSSGDSHKIEGKIDKIRLVHAGGQEQIRVPFTTLVDGKELRVEGPDGPRTFSLAERPYIEIDYTRTGGGTAVGGVALFLLGVPFTIGGIAAFTEAADANNGSGLEQLATPILGMLGIASLGLGIALHGTGIYFMTKSPPRPRPGYAGINPTLQVGPQGVSFTQKF